MNFSGYVPGTYPTSENVRKFLCRQVDLRQDTKMSFQSFQNLKFVVLWRQFRLEKNSLDVWNVSGIFSTLNQKWVHAQ